MATTPRRYTRLAIDDPAELLFGTCPHPVTTRHGLVIGGGAVYPELNFTLPDVDVCFDTLQRVEAHYRDIIQSATKRAVELELDGLVVEFETVPPMTEHPDIGMAVCDILLDGLAQARDRHGLKSALRMTPNDNREFIRPPRMRSGRYWDAMLELFDRSAAAGADFLSIESVGGKEVHDDALQMCDLPQAIFALCVLGVNDMRFLWSHLVDIARKHGVHAAGDTACGFGNTAMVLAEQKMIPRVFAAVDRALTTVRSRVAHECGAVGPGKDCGYENIFLKAITGCPMSNEGKSASCAHASPVGNIASAACDLWSNESVQHVKLLGGMAPTCSLETLAYDARLLNEAAADGDDARRQLQHWLCRSDARRDPQAFVLQPDVAIRVARSIVEADDPYRAGVAACRTTLDALTEGHRNGELHLPERELPWLDTLNDQLDSLPDNRDAFIEQQVPLIDAAKCDLTQYDLEPAPV